MYDYKADDLEEDELFYELRLREQTNIADGTPLSGLRRDLRHWLKHDRIYNPQYETQLKIEDEYPLISAKIAELKNSVQVRPTSKARSRLIHLRNRILRTNAPGENSSKLKWKLVDEVETLLCQFFGFVSPSDAINTLSENFEQTSALTMPNMSEHLAPANIVIRDGNFFVIDPMRVNFNANNFANISSLGFPMQENMFNSEHGPYRVPASVLELNISPPAITSADREEVTEPNNRRESNVNRNSILQSIETGTRPRLACDQQVVHTSSTNSSSRTQTGPIIQNQSRIHTHRTSSPERNRSSENIPRVSQFEFPTPNTNTNREVPNLPAEKSAPVSNTNNRASRSDSLRDKTHQNPNSTPISMDSFTRALDEIRFQDSSRNVTETNQQQKSQSVPDQDNIRDEIRTLVRNLVRESVQDYFSEIDQLPTPTLPSQRSTVQVLPRQENLRNSQPVNNIPLVNNTPSRNEEQNRQSPAGNNSFPNNSNIPPAPPINQMHDQYINMGLRTKIEKWQVQFSGDSRSLSVSDFVRQITILANANRVSKEQLLQQSYLFFTGEARKWYFTYYEKFQTWDHLVYYLNLNFENPNKNKAIEDAIRERKQKGNERFSQYLADMERLFQSLSYRTEERQKLKIIYENMKMSYKRRLALTPVYSLTQLTEYCYSFDSLEPSLFTPVNQRAHPINLIENSEGEDADTCSDEELNALFKARKFKTSKTKTTEECKDSPKKSQNDKDRNICWNCREEGHWYTNCSKPRSVFCYVCGEPSFTVKTCPNKHFSRSQSPKN